MRVAADAKVSNLKADNGLQIPIVDNLGDVLPLQGALCYSSGILYTGDGTTWAAGGGVIGVSSVNSRTGSIVLDGSSSVSITEGPSGTFTFEAPLSGVSSVNSRTGSIVLDGSSSVTITEGPTGTFTFESSGVASATPLNIPNAIVQRDGAGSFAAQNVDMVLAKLKSGINYVNLSADPALGSTYDFKFPSSPSTGNAQTVTSSGSTNVFYDLHAQHEVTVRKNPGPEEFSSLSLAIASIPLFGPESPSDINRYVIYMHPGTYSETSCIVPSYVYVVGIASGGVVLTPSGVGYSVIVLNRNTSLFSCEIKDTDPSFPAIRIIGSSSLFKINLIDCSLGISCETDGLATEDNISTLQNISVSGVTSNVVTVSDSNILGGFGSKANISNLLFSGTSSNCIILDGLNTKANFTSLSLTGNGTGNALIVNNGSTLEILGASLNNWNVGIYIPTTTGTPTANLSGIIYTDCVTNFNIIQSDTIGFNDGYTEYTKSAYPDVAPFFIVDKPQTLITVSPKGGDFTNIAAALASITDSSLFKPYTVLVAPGFYLESQIIMKPYVTLQGMSGLQSIIIGVDPTKTLICGAGGSTISNLVLSVADPFAPSLYLVDFQGNPAGDIFNIFEITFVTTGNCLYVGSLGGPSYVIMRQCIIDSNTPLTTFIISTDAGPDFNVVGIAVQGLLWFPNAPGLTNLTTLIDIECTKPGGAVNNIFVVNNSEFGDIFSGTNGKGISCIGATYVGILACGFAGFVVACHVRNSAEPNIFVLNGGKITFSAQDILIENPNTSGSIFCTAAYDKISVVAGAPIGICAVNPDGGILLAGPIIQGSDMTTVTNITQQIQQDSALGVLHEQPTITPTGGLGISIPAGEGYLMVGSVPNDNLKYVEWGISTINLVDNDINWLYIDQNGTLNTTGSYPDPTTQIILGAAKTNSGSITYIQESAHVLRNISTNIDNVLRRVFGPIVSSGCMATPGSNGAERAVAVSSGVYNLSVDEYPPVGGDNVSMIGYYGPSSSATQTAPFTNIPLQYDNSGVLTAIPAGKWVKHSLSIISSLSGTTQYFFVYGQQLFNSELEAQEGPVPAEPSTFVENMCPIAAVIVTDTDPSSPLPVNRFRDIRPTLQYRSDGVSASADHNSLTNLTVGDAHTQYFRTDGTRIMAGNIQLGTNNITGAGGNLLNGVDLLAHASRHLPGGADALTTAAPVSISSFNNIGIAAAFSRSDHVHRGVASVKANAGAQGFGDIVLTDGTNLSIVEAPTGTFTFNVPVGAGGVSSITGTASQIIASAGTGAVTLSLANPVNVATTGSAATLTTPRTINGVAFDGSSNIVVTADAGTLTGTTLNATVTGSSLTSVGTITSGTWNGTTINVANGGTGVATLTSGNFLQGNGTGSVITTKPVPSGAVVGTTDSQNLTNKTITDSTNNVTANGLRTATTTVSISGATAPTTGQVLTATSGTVATWQTPSTSGITGSTVTQSTSVNTGNSFFVDIPGMTITITTSGAAFVSFGLPVSPSGTNRTIIVRITDNTGSVTYVDAICRPSSSSEIVTLTGSKYVTGLTPGSNTFKMQYQISSGTVTSDATVTQRYLSVVPL